MTTTANGHIEPNKALSTFENALTIDLNESMPEPIEVRFVEWKKESLCYADGEPVLDEKGEACSKRTPYPRLAVINSFVPMYLFNKLINSRQNLSKFDTLRSAVDSGEDVQSNANFGPMIDWMYEQVLGVWRLTEPNMSKDRFNEGLVFEQVFGLFGRFFVNLLQRWQAQMRFNNATRNQ